MSNESSTAPRKSVTNDMAALYGMEPDSFEKMVRAMCSPQPKRGEQAVPLTPAEFAAFILVAKQYDLNPLTKEIYAYPRRGGGIVPVVSIDGWVKLINRQPTFNGFNLVPNEDDKGALISYTCSIHHKDRAHPTVVTEYLSECRRDTEPWKMVHRMLRHKALTQTGRYAFGFSGIYDDDEARIIAEVGDAERIRPPAPPARTPVASIEHKPAIAIEVIAGIPESACVEDVVWTETAEVKASEIIAESAAPVEAPTPTAETPAPNVVTMPRRPPPPPSRPPVPPLKKAA
jgi:phage recombination protein Bet